MLWNGSRKTILITNGKGRFVLNYLVTGAAGFIGGGIAKRLLDEGHEVTTIDNLSTGRIERIPSGCKFINGDVSEKTIIDNLQNIKFDGIIHMAGQSSGEISFDNPIYDLHANVQSTLLLLQYAILTGCNKFIYASSMSVYGDHIPPVCTEQTETLPKSLYAVGKLASENYMRIYSNMGITCTALRFFNVYGIGQNLWNLRQGMASIFLAMAIKDQKIHVKGSKNRYRDFVYIDDVVDAVILCLSRKSDYDVFNVCTGTPTTVETLIKTICSECPGKIEVEYSGQTQGDQFGIYGNNNKISNVLGWQPKVNFRTGMKKMIDWALSELS